MWKTRIHRRLQSRDSAERPAVPRKHHAPGLLRLKALVVTITIIAGCSTMAGLEPFDVTLADLEITEITVFETTLRADLRVTNPNPENFTIDGGTFKLYLEDKKIGSGAAPETFTLQRLDSTLIEAVFHINNASALLRLQDLLGGDREVSYGIRGALFVRGTLGTSKVKIDKSGRLGRDSVQLPATEDAS